MKKRILLFLFLFCKIAGFTQTFNNSWIAFSPSQPYSIQQYFKIKIVKEGIYRIDKSVLLDAGIPIQTVAIPNASVNYKNLQLFLNGQEQAIYIDTLISGTDVFMNYLEFYGKGNDGALDGQLYIDANNNKDSTKQANPYYSLFSDTATYFLTWNSLTTNKRYISESDTLSAGYTPTNYFFRNVINQYTDSYFEGKSFDSDYIEGEGWFGSEFRLGQNVKSILNTPNVYSAGPAASSQITAIGASDYASTGMDHHLQIQLPGITTDSLFDGYGLLKFRNILNPSLLGISTTPIEFLSIDDWNDINNPGRFALAYVALKYPHSTSFNGENASGYQLYVAENAFAPKTFFNFTNLTISPGARVRLFDLSNNKIIATTQSGGNVKALIPNSGIEKHCYLTFDNATTSITALIPVNKNSSVYGRFSNYQNPTVNYDYIIITHASLMIEAINYRNYRNTRFKVLLADIDELYSQFSFGIAKHPLAIKSFMDMILRSWTVAPQHLFLLGKSIDPSLARQNPSVISMNLVPTYGYPPADNLLTTGLNTAPYVPSVPVGRLSAQNDNDIQIYLDKVKAYEQAPPSAWMKNILHFGGGTDINEQSQFRSYLNDFKNTIEKPYFGGKVISFFKNSSAVIQINQSDYLHSLIDTGVSIITFFGHSYKNGFDQNIDLPSAYNNKDRYPLIIANSCFAGNIHTTDRSISEDFVLIENKGAIGFLASITEGFSDQLFSYSSDLYKEIGFNNYGKSIGTCMKATIGRILQNNLDYLKDATMEMTLHGDPAIIINSPNEPDLVISPPAIFFTPQNVTTLLDSFTVNVIIRNIGKLVTDSFDVTLKRTLADGSEISYLQKTSMTNSSDTILFRLPVQAQNGVGTNTIHVLLDTKNVITPEISELNNEASVEMIIQSDEIIPVYPYKYAIIPNDTTTLKASTSNPFAAAKDYIFQIDTTDAFNSPALKSQVILQASGGLVKWNPNINFKDSLVYYWRVSPNASNGNYKWRESSFIYIPGKTGWSQAHIFQFKDDVYQDIVYKKPERTFDFVTNIAALSVNNVPSLPDFKINSTLQDDYGNCYTPSMLLVVVDPLTLETWTTRNDNSTNASFPSSPDHSFGNYNDGGGCGRSDRAERYFAFRADDPQQLKNMRGMISKIPTGFYILAVTGGRGGFNTWDDSTFKAFEALGSNKIRSLTNNSYIFFAQKGNSLSAQEVVGDTANSNISFNVGLNGKWNLGHIVSEVIGPANKWTSLHWHQRPMEFPTKDTVLLSVYGIDRNGKDTLIIKNLSPGTPVEDLSFINEKAYPYMRLDAYMRDDSLRTPAYLNKWQIYYEPKPEAALNPSKLFSFYQDNIDEGDSIKLTTLIENISPYDMDSMLVFFAVYDQNRNAHKIPYKRRRPLLASGNALGKDTLTISFSTKGLAGLNSLWIEANPNNDQLEQYHFNNLGEIFFNVNKDKTNPLMDVTFDGIHILDDDIVSSKPFIVIQLRDENKFLRLDTSSLFKLYLKYPNATDEVLIPFDNIKAKFIPAQASSTNKCQAQLTPGTLNDGKYQLRIQAKDKSSNLSGYQDYSISFEVINKSSISEVMNYPNPFSTSTRFVFTLTGSEIPTYFKIQIMTVTGKIIREIMLDELGPIHIGRNITEYAWNGKDEFGDPLANGLYLYHVITRLNGNSVESLESGADKFFNNGYGKMYLMR